MENLETAADQGDLNGLYSSIQEDHYILDRIDAIPFFDTPLHRAASKGHTEFAMEIVRLKPSFGRRLNPVGLSPLHLAAQNGHFETVRRLIKFDKELIRVKGREGHTPLHYVAEIDDIDLLSQFLCFCPESFEDLTVRDETAVHVAVKNFNLRAFQVLQGWLRRTYNTRMLNWKDQDGNTVLHTAVSTSQTQIVELLARERHMDKDERNLKGLTALDTALKLDSSDTNAKIRQILLDAGACEGSSLPDDSNLAGFLRSPERFFEVILSFILHARKDLSMEMRNVVLIVAVLIATTTFQAVLSPPGGGGGRLSNIRSSSTDARDSLIYFYFPNTLAFTASIMVITIVLQIRPFSAFLHFSLMCLWGGYGFLLFRILPLSHSIVEYLVILSYVSSLLVYGSRLFFSDIKMSMKLLTPSSRLAILGSFWKVVPRLQQRRLCLLYRFVN